MDACTFAEAAISFSLARYFLIFTIQYNQELCLGQLVVILDRQSLISCSVIGLSYFLYSV